MKTSAGSTEVRCVTVEKWSELTSAAPATMIDTSGNHLSSRDMLEIVYLLPNQVQLAVTAWGPKADVRRHSL